MDYTPIIAIIIGIAAIIFYRQVSMMFRPIKGNGSRIILTLLLLSPGSILIMNPNATATQQEIIIALLFGAILSIPLILTTSYERRADGRVYVKKSIVFVVLFLSIYALRWTIRGMLDMDQETRMALFFIVACGYLIPWKIASYYKFRKVNQSA